MANEKLNERPNLIKGELCDEHENYANNVLWSDHTIAEH